MDERNDPDHDAADRDGDSTRPPSDGQRLVIGLFAVSLGMIPILAGFDVPPFAAGKVRGVPDWLLLVAGATFICGGLAAMTQKKIAALSELFALAVLVGLATMANWIGFGAGPRNCTSSLSGFFWREAGDLECRAAFGWGGLVLNAFIIMGVAAVFERDLGPRRWLIALRKLGEWLLVALFLPFILLLLVIVIFKSGREVFGDWLRKRFQRGGP